MEMLHFSNVLDKKSSICNTARLKIEKRNSRNLSFCLNQLGGYGSGYGSSGYGSSYGSGYGSGHGGYGGGQTTVKVFKVYDAGSSSYGNGGNIRNCSRLNSIFNQM